MLRHFRLPAAMAFARANRFDRIALDSPRPRFGIAASGKGYLHVRQALRDLGLDDGYAAALGIRVYKIGLVWPLEEEGARAFADGLETVLVVEERRDVIEHQLRAAAYGLADGRRPRILGKRDASGAPLISDVMDIDTAQVARAILRTMPQEWMTEELRAAEERLNKTARAVASQPLHTRTPYFCSGCPHSTSTRVPEGSRAVAGIGCHYLVTYMNRNTDAFTQMGGEGALWVGQAPFTSEQHIFANIGDGTYFHSGSLAIRQAVAAGRNITYKILYNDAVAMTGGQPVDGQLSVPAIAAQMRAEGVKRIAIVSDNPDRFRGNPQVPPGVTFDHRSRLDAVQKDLRDVPGVSVIIYDQVCATEKRRRRKRGLMEQSERRVIINEGVCEGCGDCSRASNCLSVEPIETEFGRKRRINQSTCNQDFSCVDGFCPSFVSVYGGTLRREKPQAHEIADLPEPRLPVIGADGYNILMTGIGGLGITSLAAILGMAAHLHNRQVRVLDQIGLAQKGGGVYSHLRIGEQRSELFTSRIGAGQADLVLAADMVVAHGKSGLPMMSAQRTAVVCGRADHAHRRIRGQQCGQLQHRIHAGAVEGECAYRRGMPRAGHRHRPSRRRRPREHGADGLCLAERADPARPRSDHARHRTERRERRVEQARLRDRPRGGCRSSPHHGEGRAAPEAFANAGRADRDPRARPHRLSGRRLCRALPRLCRESACSASKPLRQNAKP